MRWTRSHKKRGGAVQILSSAWSLCGVDLGTLSSLWPVTFPSFSSRQFVAGGDKIKSYNLRLILLKVASIT